MCPDPRRVLIVTGHHNWIALAYAHFICCYHIKESTGWQLVFTSPYLERSVERLALNSRVVSVNQPENKEKMIAISFGSQIRLWSCHDETSKEIGKGKWFVRDA